MRKAALLLFATLAITLGMGAVHARGETPHTASAKVTANSQTGNYKKELNQQAEAVTTYVDNITLTDIEKYFATPEEVGLVNEGKTFTLVTTVTAKKYTDIVEAHPEIGGDNNKFKYVMSLDIVLSKKISNDIDGLSVISESTLTELAKPVEIELETSAFDKKKKEVSKCKMVRIHNELAEEIPVTYDKKTGAFAFASDRFSDYLLYFTLKDIAKPTQTPIPTPKPTVRPTPEPTKRPTAEPTPVPKTDPIQDINPQTPVNPDAPGKIARITPIPKATEEPEKETVIEKEEEPVVLFSEMEEDDTGLSNNRSAEKETKLLSGLNDGIQDVNEPKGHNLKLILVIIVPLLLLLLILLLIYIGYKNRQLKKKLEEENEVDTEEFDDFDGSNEKEIDDFDI